MEWYVVRVIDLNAEKEGEEFLVVANNFFAVADSKKQARKQVNKMLTDQKLVYGRDFTIGCVGKYTGNGKSVGFVGDKFKNMLPQHEFVAYKKVPDENSKRESPNDIKFAKYSQEVVSKFNPSNFDEADEYICQNGEFVVHD